ncbi:MULTISPECIES: RnfH family protein [Ectothiorhodospira]|uniref:RnfH family protein n=1 Tax=Ectothiorhodospira TaxID=1051 RepID=UPI001EE7C32D|nr:RnfH family protein [Ectothiorhodospira variabilis]MCG5497065.1 RnfH family protein [Ectothiorhodospira variabilis]MCG5502542.1 RnfH family protein [Ectothiorhodospira variabilis]MCG5505692.1 RnfH family protein [Ectothiorhodospira variabilis]MCG5525417.1 RnfH family protein [Ectothiorhodospira haloalkaliphila]
MPADKPSGLRVEVAYARPEKQVVLEVSLPEGATVEQAIQESGILDQCPEVDLASNKVGVYGKLAKLNAPLRDRDRVEIYRPLIADPKAVRKQRAAQ